MGYYYIVKYFYLYSGVNTFSTDFFYFDEKKMFRSMKFKLK